MNNVAIAVPKAPTAKKQTAIQQDAGKKNSVKHVKNSKKNQKKKIYSVKKFFGVLSCIVFHL
jgi:hypothetical protein